MAKFKDYNFPPFLQKALEKIDFTEPTAVQERLIPVIRQGKNVIGQSKTGSGKTHTFLLPIIEKIKPELNQVQAVITVPSRELAEQIYQAAIELVQFAEVEYRIANYVGGTDRKRQLEKLEHTQPHLANQVKISLKEEVRQNPQSNTLVKDIDLLVKNPKAFSP